MPTTIFNEISEKSCFGCRILSLNNYGQASQNSTSAFLSLKNYGQASQNSTSATNSRLSATAFLSLNNYGQASQTADAPPRPSSA